MIGMNVCEGAHHFFKRSLVVHNFVCRWERVADTVLFKEVLKFLGNDVPQRHLAGNFDAVDFELSCDLARCLCHLGVADHGLIGGIFSHKGQYRHQV